MNTICILKIGFKKGEDIMEVIENKLIANYIKGDMINKGFLYNIH